MGDLSVGSLYPCGDCGTADPEWASLNRGLLLCKECSFVHRSLGPQYSRVKSINESKWHPNLKKMMMILAGGAANHVWEHTLLGASKPEKDASIKKPWSNESLETKKKFIQMKHFQYQFVLRSTTDSFEVRNQELHSTVRTSALDTTLRLLACGADPNFFHPEKGTRPIHVAARNGQALQVELLFLHGAHTDAADYLGQTPVEHAMAAGHKDLAQRIMELRYELTDQLSYFVCSEYPDHGAGKHIVIPNNKSINAKQDTAIQNLPPNVLEQLAADLYDEVDRRQIEKIIASTSEAEKAQFSIAFLPVNQIYPSVRNQTRQKFARLTDEELRSLITLVLTESKRRHCNGTPDVEIEKDIFLNSEAKEGSPCNIITPTSPGLTEDDDFPLYDSVASDEDIILAEQQTILAQQRATLDETTLISSSNVKLVSNCDVNDFKENSMIAKLMEAEAKIQELQDNNQNFKQEIIVLQRMVNSILHENLELRSGTYRNRNQLESYSSPKLVNGHNGDRKSPSPFLNSRLKSSRPSSMCEPKTFQHEKFSLSGRPKTTEVCTRRGQLLGVTNLVQETTRRIVELIKVLIEYATSKDLQGVQLTSNAIYEEVQEMATSLVVMEIGARKDIKDSLENIIFQVLRMKSEIPVFFESQKYQKSAPLNSPLHSSPTLLQKVKQICFDVGAAMKQLMSSVVPPQL